MAKLRWTVTFIVDETWVADGFDLTDECAKEMIEARLPYATPYETGAIVTKFAPAARVAAMQGYKNPKAVEDTRRERALVGGKYYQKPADRKP